jgi:hypothetical protein
MHICDAGMGGGDAPWQGSGPNKAANANSSTFLNRMGAVFSGDDNEPAYSGHPGSGHDTQSPPMGGTNGSGGANSGNSGYYVSPYRSSQQGEVFSTTTKSGMQGFGNSPADAGPAMEGRSLAAKAAQGIASVVSAVSSGVSNLNSASSSSGKEDFGYATNRGPNAFGQNNTYSPSSQGFNSSSSNGFSSRTTNVWGNATSNSSNSSTTSGRNEGPAEPGAIGQPGSIVPDIPRHSSGIGRAGGAQSDGAYERTMVEGLCESAGLKVVPPEDKLETFLTAAQTLSPDLVGPCLIDELNSESWQSRTKALIVIASLAKAKGCFAHSAWWVGQSDIIRTMANDPRTSVRTQALKCMRALKIPNSIAASGSNIINPTPVAEDLLLDDDAVVAEPQSSPRNQAAPAAPVDLFGGMTTNTQHSGGDMFAGMAVAAGDAPQQQYSQPPQQQYNQPSVGMAAAAPAAPVGGAFDFLGDFGDSAAPAMPPPPPPVHMTAPMSMPMQQPQQPQQSAPSSFDFLSSGASAPSGPAGVTDMFSNMSMGGGASALPPQQQPHVQMTSPSSTGNYSVDFMGLDASPVGAAMYDAYNRPQQQGQPMMMMNSNNNMNINMQMRYPPQQVHNLNLSQPVNNVPAQYRPQQPPMQGAPQFMPPVSGFRLIVSV